MKTIRLLFAVLLIPAFSVGLFSQMNIVEIPLSGSWQFKATDDDGWLPAQVPGAVHTDLLANGLIDDPFYRTNERRLQWIDKKDWEYRTTFEAGPSLMACQRVELEFLGIDTYGELMLNGRPVLLTDNMFRNWKVDIRPYLQKGRNELHLLLHSPVNRGLAKYEAQGYVIPVSDNDQSQIGGLGEKKVSIYTRKAGYHFGWDWGPRLVTSGIWRPVVLRGWNTAIIRDLYVQQVELLDNHANLRAITTIEAAKPGRATLQIQVEGEVLASRELELKAGIQELTLDFGISNPCRWWPNGMGEQYRYAIEARLLDKKQKRLSERQVKVGLRTIELVRENDEQGQSFYFRVNGYPVFMKGANYIPQDIFLPRVSPQRYEHLLQSAKESNMNMLRVWGGGIYEEDLFYELCDQKGLLVWQDFMFACAMFPGDEAFLENVRQEAIDNVRRLRNHPSIALWCGNNEILSAWHGWGWKNKVEKEQGKAVADAIWQAYDTLFHHLLPEVVAAEDPGRFYWSSSPSADTGQPENWVSGDVHYWGVWWGQEPFDQYQQRIPRFMSEFGFQSFPELRSIKQFAREEDYHIFSEVLQSHQRSSIGNGTIVNYMDRDYRQPKNFASFLYVGQALQAEGIKTGIEAQRRNRPYCMGSLFWQIDDCWPVASWSSIDYYGRWKALQYYAKKAFSEVLVSPVVEAGQLKVFVVSDRIQPSVVELRLQLLDFNGTLLWAEKCIINLKGNSSEVWLEMPEAELLGVRKREEVVLYAEVVEGDEVLSENTLYFAPPKSLNLPAPNISLHSRPAEGGYILHLSSDRLARHVFLALETDEGMFSDNYFDLLPNQPVEIRLKTRADIPDLPAQIQVRSLVDSYQGGEVRN